MINQKRQRKIVVSECFGGTIQGEGILIGHPTVVVRTGGCDYRCQQCDTLYAVLPNYRAQWHPLSPEEVFAEVERLSGHTPILVTLSGGNPAIQPFAPLLQMGHAAGYTFALETQGSIGQPWFAELDYLTFSPKAPGMKHLALTDWARLDRCIALARSGERQPQICLKIVIFDEVDYAYAHFVGERYPTLPLYLQPGNHTPPHLASEMDLPGIMQRLEWLIERVIQDRWYAVTVLPQLHTLIWGNKRGV